MEPKTGKAYSCSREREISYIGWKPAASIPNGRAGLRVANGRSAVVYASVWGPRIRAPARNARGPGAYETVCQASRPIWWYCQLAATDGRGRRRQWQGGFSTICK